MQYQGYSVKNLHTGDVRITGNLQVDGQVEINDINVNSLTIGDPEYTLPTEAGTDGQVIVMNPDNKTSDWKDLTSGTARIWQNLYTMRNFNPNDADVNYQNFDIDGYGSKSINIDNFPVGSIIKNDLEGQFKCNTPGNDTLSASIRFGFIQDFDVFQSFTINNSFIAGANFVYGYWKISCTYTRISQTEILLGAVSLTVNFDNSFIAGNYKQQGPIQTSLQNPALDLPITITAFTPNTIYPINISYKDESVLGAQLYMIANRYTIDICTPNSQILATSENLTTDHTLLSNLTLGDSGHTQFALLQGRSGGQILSGGTTNLHDLKLKSHTAGLDNVVIKDLNTEFKKNIDMNGNSITNLQNIDVGGGTLNIANTGFPAMNITGGVNFNNTGFIYQCPSVFAGAGNLDIGSDFGIVNIQTGPFGSRQTEIAIIPNLINVNSPITNFVGGDVYLSQNRIQDVSAIDDGANNSIDMKDTGLGNSINIKSVGAGVNLEEQSTGNRIGVNTTGLGSQVVSGGTIIQNSDAVNNLTLSKTNGGQIFLQNTAVGGDITGEAEQIDFNYTTTNFKVRNGLTNNFVIEPTQVESFLNFVCPSINGISPVGGIFAGTADSLVYNPSIDGAIEKSIMPTSIVGSLTVPANGFSVGDSFHLVLAGDFNSNNGDTLNIRLYGGPTSAVLLANLPVPLTASSGVSFEVECDFQLRIIGGPGVADICSNFDFTYNGGAGSNFRGERGVFQNNTTFSTLTDNILLVTAQYSTTNANNSMKTIVSKLSKTY